MPTLNLTKLVTSQDTFGEMVEKINANFDIISQAQGLRGEEGKRGVAGIPGPPGAIGPQGEKGSTGLNGNRWYFGEDFSEFNTSTTNIGDYFLEGATGDIRERKISGWELVGSVVGGGTGGDSGLFNSFIPLVNNDTKIIKPIKTNYTFEITDISGTSLSYDVTPFSDGADTANFVIGQSTTTQKWLQEMGLKIYTSEGDNTSTLYGKGKQLHLVNSTGLVANKNIGWANQSGFTLTVDWDDSEPNTEVLRLKNIKSVDPNHIQRIEIESDSINLISDYIYADGPLKLYNVNKNAITPEYGTLVYDTNTNNVFAYRQGSPDAWIQLGGAGTSSGNIGFTHARLFDNADVEIPLSTQTAGSPDTTFRLKAGNGITIEPLGSSPDKWEIRLSSASSQGVDDFGTVRVKYTDGNGNLQTKFSIASDDPGDILEIEEGDNITITNTSDLTNKRIKISSAGGNGGTNSFVGMKYVYGQLGRGAFPGAPTEGKPLANPFIEIPNVIALNNGTLRDMRLLDLPTSVPGFTSPSPFSVNTVPGQGTTFTATRTGFWQINVFAFGLIKMPNYNNEIPYYPGYTIVGAITKNRFDYSHISIAESSFINPIALFDGLGFTDASQYQWPTWTVNCSDIVYLTDSSPDTIGVSVGALYVPLDQNGTFIYGTQASVDLYYCSGYISAVYLGDG